MTYESEVLFKLMERDGFNIPSSVPPYEAEIKAYLINQVKNAYPKLTDYEAEWLLYNYTKHLPADFPISSVTNVTNASFENVVPFAYQSAILTGNTLVNIHPPVYNIKSNSSLTIFYADVNLKKEMFKTNTKYLVRLYNTDSAIDRVYMKHCVTDRYYITENKSAIFTTKSEFEDNEFVDNKIHFYSPNSVPLENVANTKILICEYQDGMENWDIPYFDGMHSVKMPVLTTSNEDGTKTNILTVNEDVELRGVGDVKDELDCLTGKVTKRFEEINLSELQTGFYAQNAMATDCYSFYYNPQICKPSGKALGNNLPSLSRINEGEGIYISASGRINLNIKSHKMTDSSLNSFTNYLTNNPTIIQYEVPTESIKTVDLKTINENGESVYFMPLEGTMHVSCNSQTIQPTFDMSVPVEATTQNLASFIDLEMEE